MGFISPYNYCMRMHHWSKYYLVIFLLGKITLAQNLVNNGGFEIYDTCPTNTGQLNLLSGWFNINSPDLYSTCASNSWVSVPLNYLGFQSPMQDSSYVGVAMGGNDSNSIGRELIISKLKSSLISDSIYELKFYYSNCNLCSYFNDGLSVYFSEDSLYYNGSGMPNWNAQVRVSSINTDTADWIEFKAFYVAQGGEQFISIGNHYSYSELTHVGEEGEGSYIYIDDVSIRKVSAQDTITEPPPPNPVDTTAQENYLYLFPNPANSITNLSYGVVPGSQGNFYLYDASGKLIYREELATGKATLPIDVQNYAAGIYLWQCRINGGFFKSGKLVIQR